MLKLRGGGSSELNSSSSASDNSDNSTDPTDSNVIDSTNSENPAAESADENSENSEEQNSESPNQDESTIMLLSEGDEDEPSAQSEGDDDPSNANDNNNATATDALASITHTTPTTEGDNPTIVQNLTNNTATVTITFSLGSEYSSSYSLSIEDLSSSSASTYNDTVESVTIGTGTDSNVVTFTTNKACNIKIDLNRLKFTVTNNDDSTKIANGNELGEKNLTLEDNYKAPSITLDYDSATLKNNGIYNESAFTSSDTVSAGTLMVEDPFLSYLVSHDGNTVVAKVTTVKADGTSGELKEIKLSDLIPQYESTESTTYTKATYDINVNKLEPDAVYEIKSCAITSYLTEQTSETKTLSSFTVKQKYPEISVTWDKPLTYVNEYINETLTATITVKEYSKWWDTTSFITINATINGEKQPIDTNQFTTGSTDTNGKTTYTYEQKFEAAADHSKDGKYSLVAEVTDKAGNSANVDKKSFTIDTTPPEAKVTIFKTAADITESLSDTVVPETCLELQNQLFYFYGEKAKGKKFVLVELTDPNDSASGVKGATSASDTTTSTNVQFREDDSDSSKAYYLFTTEATDGEINLSELPQFKATDNVGNEKTYAIFDKVTEKPVLVIDTVKPVVTMTNSMISGMRDRYESTHLKANEPQKISFKVEDKNLTKMIQAAKSSETEYNPVIATVKTAENGEATGETVKTIDIANLASDGEFKLDLMNDLDAGDYILEYTPTNVKDLANNVATDQGDKIKFTVDTDTPQVSVTPNLKGNSSLDGYRYLSSSEDSTYTVKITDASIDDMAADSTLGARNIVTIENTTANETKNYTLATLMNVASGVTLNGVTASYDSDSSTLTATFILSDKSSFTEGVYNLKVHSDGLEDLAGRICATADSELNYVIDRTPADLSLIAYGAQGSNGVQDMQNIYDGAFFYQFTGNEYFVFLQATDSEYGAGITSISYVSGEGIRYNSNTIAPSSRIFTQRVRDGNDAVLCLAFLSETVVATGSIVVEVTDNCGNSQPYAINYNDGKISVVKGGQTQNTKPATLVNDFTSPTASIDFGALSGYYDAGQSGNVSIADANLARLISYAKNNQGTSYDAVIATVYATDNSGNTTSREVRVRDFSTSGTSATLAQTFGYDADYRIVFTPSNLIDLSNNRCGSASQTVEFTVDTIDPTINVTWDNNNVRNGKYYNAARTATITVVEHNFDASRVTINAQGGTIGSWSSNGDTHTITVRYGSGATCNLSVNMTDLAGRAANYQGEEFVVDLTAPTITFSNVEAQTAYGDVVEPNIIYTDEANFDSNGITWTLTGAKNGQKDFATSTAATTNGATVSFADFEREITNDDIYTLTAQMTDLAGNEFENEIVFSVNRFGSNYIILNEEQYEGRNGYLAEPVDVTVQEINVCGAESEKLGVTVTRGMDTDNLKLLSSRNDSSTGYYIASGADTYGWSTYTYHINAENFVEDGNYNVSVNSEDRAGNLNTSASYNNPDTGDGGAVAVVNFVLDTTDPLIDGISIESKQMYEGAPYDVSFTVTDNIGFDTVEVTVDGDTQEVTPDASGLCTVSVDDQAFTERDMEIVATDLAGRTATATVEGFHVTTNFVELHWPVLVGVGVVAAGAGAFFVVRNRKKKAAEGAGAEAGADAAA